MKRGVVALVLLWLGLAAAAVAAPGDARAVLQQKIGPSAAQAFYFAEALRRLERPAEAAALDRYLAHAYVQEVGGEFHDLARTVGQAVGLGNQLPPPDQSIDLRRRWREHLNAKLVLELPRASRTLPGEIEAMAEQLKELSPGLWSAMNGTRPRALYLFAAFANRSMAPLALTEFHMEVLHKPGTEALKFSCTPERDKATPFVIASGQRADFLCRSTAIPANDAGEKVATVLAQARERQLLRLDSREFDDARSVARVAKALVGLKLDELAELLPKPAAAAQESAVVPVAAKGLAMADRPPEKSEGRWAARGETLLLLLLLFAVLGAYWGLAKMLGNGAAAFLVWLSGTIYVASLIVKDHSLPSSDWGGLAALMIYIMLLVAPIFAAWTLHLLFQMVDEPADREASKKRALTLVIEIVVDMVLALITGKRR